MILGIRRYGCGSLGIWHAHHFFLHLCHVNSHSRRIPLMGNLLFYFQLLIGRSSKFYYFLCWQTGLYTWYPCCCRYFSIWDSHCSTTLSASPVTVYRILIGWWSTVWWRYPFLTRVIKASAPRLHGPAVVDWATFIYEAAFLHILFMWTPNWIIIKMQLSSRVH